MKIDFLTDTSTEGMQLKKRISENSLVDNQKNTFTIRWGNTTEIDKGDIILNTSQSIRNTLDKENVILTLRRSSIRSPRRIKPGKKTDFPILGRKYNHRNGTDIRIIDSLDEYHRCDCDYFIQYLKLEQEFRLHVMDLDIFYIEEKIHPGPSDFGEPILRTTAFGWSLIPTDLTAISDEEKEEIFLHAKKSIHALGLDFGVVNIGKTASGKFYVLDVDPVCKTMSLECLEAYANQFFKTIQRYQNLIDNPTAITIGADPECLLKDKITGAIICASDFFDREGMYGLDNRSIEAGQKYFPLLEIRPDYSLNPMEVFSSIESILTTLYRDVHYKNVGLYSGSMPIYNYWLGGHIHFGTKPNEKLIKALDNYLALPLMMIERPDTARQRKKTYGVLGNYRHKFHGGFEYCTLSSWLISPNITAAVLCLAKVVVQEFLHLQENFLSSYADIRAYYLVNKMYFSDTIQQLLDSIKKTATYQEYSAILDPFFLSIQHCQQWTEEKDIKESWNFTSSDQIYRLPSICFMPRSTRRKLDIRLGQKITLLIRNKKHRIKIYPKDDLSSEKTGYVSFSEDICQLLGIHTEDTFGIFYDTLQNLYHIGPIFGIFAYRESHYMGPFALQTYYFRKLIKLSHNKGILAYVFTIWDIDWENHRVEGYTYNFEKEEWTKQFFPLPDVIYDRGDVICEDNYGQYALDYLEYIKKNNIKLINSIECIEITNNKWFTYKLLDANEYTRKYLPHTWEYKSPNLLLKKLDQYEHLFLKMKDGSRSKGIFSIQKVADCSYMIYYKNIYGYNVRTSLLKKHLIEWLDVKIKETECMREHYIIQQAIHFTKYQGGNFEVRVVMQKNSKGKWLRTCMATRITKTNENFLDVWNEDNKKASQVFAECFHTRAEELSEQIREISMQVITVIDKNKVQAGEIAIDFGIDESLQIYIIELNSKPDNLLARIGAFKIRNLAINRILEYGKFLALQDNTASPSSNA